MNLTAYCAGRIEAANRASPAIRLAVLELGRPLICLIGRSIQLQEMGRAGWRAY